jgi:hypothetical protein
MWGFLYGWTLFLVIQAGTIAAVSVAFGKFLGIFIPSVSSSHWLIHIAHVPPLRFGSMILGNMDIGLNTQNLTAILVIVFLSVINIFGVKVGAAVQNVFPVAKTLALAGLILLGVFAGPKHGSSSSKFWCEFLAQWRATFASSGSGGRRRTYCPMRHYCHRSCCPGRISVFRRRLEQRHLYSGRSKEASAQPAALTRDGHRCGYSALHSRKLRVPDGTSPGGRSPWLDHRCAGHPVCL